MGRYLKLLALFLATLLILVSLSACMEPGEGEVTETTTSGTVTTTVTTTTSSPAEDLPPIDSGYDDDGFENGPEDDETKRY